MAVNQNVNPRPLTAEEKEKRARGIYDSFATYVVFCEHCRYVRKTNMYIMRAEAFIDELDARGEVCPRCGKPVYEGKKNFACSDRACQFVMWKNDRFWISRRKEMTRKMAADLLKKGHTSVKGMWSEKKGSTYDAVVILDDTGGKYVNFKLEFPKRKDGVHGKK